MARPITITVQNDTGEELVLKPNPVTLEHGKWQEDPDGEPAASIPAGGSNSWTATTVTGGSKGPEGTVTYVGNVTGASYNIAFNHPFSGAATSVTPGCSNGNYDSKIKNNHLQHHNASCTVDFYKVS